MTVGVLEPGAGLDANFDGRLGIDQPLCLEDLCSGLAFDAFHDDEVATVVDPGVIDLDDVRVDQLRDGQRFTPEPGDEAVIVGEMLGQHFHRDGPFEDPVGRAIDI